MSKFVTPFSAEMVRYESLGKIGEGTYGTVYKGRNCKTSELVALKRIRLENDAEGIPSSAIREIALLHELKHPSIVNLIEVIHGEKMLYMVFELMEMDLKKYLDSKNNGLELHEARKFLQQILGALTKCHSHRIIHRDLKPQNLLISFGGNIKLADFGLARCVTMPLKVYTHEVVTLWYRPPEILLGAKLYSSTVDIWSLGCIFAEMLTGKALFTGDSEIDQIFRICRILGNPNTDIWPDMINLPTFKACFPKWTKQDWNSVVPKLRYCSKSKELIEKMLSYDPNRRPSSFTALEDPLFKGA